jgi:hypothetical protein
VKRFARYAVSVVLALGLIYGSWLAVRSALRRMSCGSEETLKVEELTGLRFEVTYLSCDTIAKDEAIRVYAEAVAPDGSWFFSKWRNHRTLLFRYDPTRYDAPLPSITRPSQNAILISVSEVSSIDYQNRKWANMTVNYQIGQVDFPAPSDVQ